MKLLMIGACITPMITLSACQTGPNSPAIAGAKKAFNTICTAEPGIYQSVVALGKDSTKVKAAHAGIVTACENGPPENVIQALTTLTASYIAVQAALHPS